MQQSPKPQPLAEAPDPAPPDAYAVFWECVEGPRPKDALDQPAAPAADAYERFQVCAEAL